ncbi:MAG TPA: hypothetical protein VES68_00215 [Candidatus Sulfotelmatobacter sp.]|nr:hypothetical protein [Candidatus Sulfotelmatobacter sp.]
MKSDILKLLGGFLLLIIVFLVGTISIAPVMGRISGTKIVADNTIIDLSLKNYGIQWSPDGHISYVTFPNGDRRYFIAGNQRAYAIESKSNLTLEQTIKGNPVIKAVFGPEITSSYRNNYATIAEVLQTDKNNPYHVFAFTQYEQQAVKPDKTLDYSNFTASIGLLESYDGGLTWKDFGPVVRGDDYLTPGTRISGAGEPAAIIKDGYVYLYYVDWAAQVKAFHGDEIFLARTKIIGDGLGAFEFYTTNGFSTTEANLAPVVTQPTGNSGYVSLPSVSFNKYIGSYLMIYETNLGFMSEVSTDAVTWTNAKKIFTFPQAQSDRQSGNTWYSYPTLLSDNSELTDGVTQNTGNLYFSKGIWPNVAHQPAKQSFQIQ